MKKLKVAIFGNTKIAHAMNWLFESPNNELCNFEDVDLLVEWKPNLTVVCCESNYDDFSEVEDVILKTLQHTDSGVLVKTVIPPLPVASIIRTAATKGKAKKLVFSPDFSTEDNVIDGSVNPEFQILGGHADATRAMMEILRTCSNLNTCEFHLVGGVEASFIKLASNAFLSTKITFFNQLYDLIVSNGCNWPIVSRALAADSRIGKSHTKVPGKDLKRGFSNKFEKDVNELVAVSNDEFTLLKECLDINKGLRDES